jgi:hypothetical protein
MQYETFFVVVEENGTRRYWDKENMSGEEIEVIETEYG